MKAIELASIILLVLCTGCVTKKYEHEVKPIHWTVFDGEHTHTVPMDEQDQKAFRNITHIQ